MRVSTGVTTGEGVRKRRCGSSRTRSSSTKFCAPNVSVRTHRQPLPFAHINSEVRAPLVTHKPQICIPTQEEKLLAQEEDLPLAQEDNLLLMQEEDLPLVQE